MPVHMSKCMSIHMSMHISLHSDVVHTAGKVWVAVDETQDLVP